ncbi:MAG: hypothetical protein ACI82N_001273, partial [Maricaulis sp.]
MAGLAEGEDSLDWGHTVSSRPAIMITLLAALSALVLQDTSAMA